jgi:hypothetical protein
MYNKNCDKACRPENMIEREMKIVFTQLSQQTKSMKTNAED